MPEYQKRPEFVVVVDTKGDGKTVRIDNVKDLEAYLYNFSNDELAKCVWDSLLYNYKTGVKSGMRKVGAQVNE